MPALIDLTGQRFGSLVVLAQAGRGKNGAVLWRTRCACGAETETQASNLRGGSARSCGCARTAGLHAQNAKHGMRSHPLYPVWANMIRRCTDPKNARWPDYGGRGISVCARWLVLENFLADMGPAYQPGLSIDRINNDGNYEPGNCRWATRSEQQRNTRRSKRNQP